MRVCISIRDELWEKLVTLAKDERRTKSKQVEVYLERAMDSSKPTSPTSPTSPKPKEKMSKEVGAEIRERMEQEGKSWPETLEEIEATEQYNPTWIFQRDMEKSDFDPVAFDNDLIAGMDGASDE